ncbi:HTH-type transcriptional regulator GntR [Leptothrix sp. BB-4]
MKQPSPRGGAAVTLADVAALAGVSPITASRALRGTRAVDPVLVERVKAASAKLGYVPDPAARALASRRGTYVAMLVPALSNALFVELIEAAQTTLRAGGYQALLGITHYDPAEEEQILREFLQHRPAGLLLTGAEQSEAARNLVAASGAPCVRMMTLTDRPGSHCVGLSQFEAARAMTAHLQQRGYRRIAFVAVQLDARTLQRLDGWRAQMRAQGMYEPMLETVTSAPSSIALGGELFRQIVSTDLGVDAIFFCNDDLAQGALLSAARLGVPVPGQVAVAGFNDVVGSDQMVPSLTTVRTPRAAIGRQAAQLLLKLMEGQQIAEPVIDLGFELMPREST